MVRDRGASGDRALALPTRGTVRAGVRALTPTRLRIIARAPRCDARLRSNGRTSRVARGGWRIITVPLPRGDRTVTLRRDGSCAVLIDRLDVAWTPAPDTTWQWQLTGTPDLGVPAALYDVDLFDTPAATVARIHAQGARAVCYFSAGTLERGRPDPFPKAAAGKTLDDWPDERWLDVRALDRLGPVLERRLDLCVRKGFDGVEADNVDAYANDSGFPLRAADQLRFNRFLAREAHARGLSIALKNDLDQVAELEGGSTGRWSSSASSTTNARACARSPPPARPSSPSSTSARPTPSARRRGPRGSWRCASASRSAPSASRAGDAGHRIVNDDPTATMRARRSMSALRRRMQPCETAPGMRSGSLVPWMPM